MAGEIDFEESLIRRIACFEGQDEAILDRVADRMVLTPGARTFVQTLKRLGYRVAAVSGGFTFFTEKVKRKLELDHAYANTLEVVDGKLTGRVVGGVVDGPAKAVILREIAAAESIPLEQVVAVGDGANDLDMLGAAGLGIAFNAKSVVQDAADAAVNVPYLDAILFMLGIRRSEVEESQKVPARK
jgi:phosphoserine phosphatase